MRRSNLIKGNENNLRLRTSKKPFSLFCSVSLFNSPTFPVSPRYSPSIPSASRPPCVFREPNMSNTWNCFLWSRPANAAVKQQGLTWLVHLWPLVFSLWISHLVKLAGSDSSSSKTFLQPSGECWWCLSMEEKRTADTRIMKKNACDGCWKDLFYTSRCDSAVLLGYTIRSIHYLYKHWQFEGKCWIRILDHLFMKKNMKLFYVSSCFFLHQPCLWWCELYMHRDVDI